MRAFPSIPHPVKEFDFIQVHRRRSASGTEFTFMLTLGHIIFSNCYPPHAGILRDRASCPFALAEGIPTELNRLLLAGRIDVSPSSSIEYAAHPGRYLLFPGISIDSKKKVMSILLESRVPIEQLDKKTVALTTASATSVVLLRILLERWHHARPRYIPYAQDADNPAERADAMLTIGDLALTKPPAPGFPHRYDLGELWHAFTGLPFVFALWHINYSDRIERELAELYDILMASKAYGVSHLPELARESSDRFGIPAQKLLDYWTTFSYNLGQEEQRGLLAYYRYAAEIGAVAPVKELRFWSKR